MNGARKERKCDSRRVRTPVTLDSWGEDKDGRARTGACGQLSKSHASSSSGKKNKRAVVARLMSVCVNL